MALRQYEATKRVDNPLLRTFPREYRKARTSIVVETEGIGEQVNDSPQRKHEEKADQAPNHKLLTLVALFFICGALDEVSEDAPNKDNKGNGEDYRNEEVNKSYKIGEYGL